MSIEVRTEIDSDYVTPELPDGTTPIEVDDPKIRCQTLICDYHTLFHLLNH